MSDEIKITHSKEEPDSRQMIESYHIETKDGSLYPVKEPVSFGDVEIVSNFESHKKQFEFWDNIDPVDYVNKKKSEEKKHMDEWQARKDAMNLTEDEWDELKT